MIPQKWICSMALIREEMKSGRLSMTQALVVMALPLDTFKE